MANIIQIALTVATDEHITAVSYAVFAVFLGIVCVHLRWLAPYMIGAFIHIAVVSARSTLVVIWPASILWDWGDVHRLTALIAGGLGAWFIVGVIRGRV